MIGLAFIIGETKMRHDDNHPQPILTMIIADGFVHNHQRALLGLLLLSIALAAKITSRPAVAVSAWTPTTLHFYRKRRRIHSSYPEHPSSRRVALSSTSDPPATTTDSPTERVGLSTKRSEIPSRTDDGKATAAPRIPQNSSPIYQDVQVIFGSDEVDRIDDGSNEVIVGDDSEWQAYRADRVDELLRQDNRDSRYRKARKIEQWGSFANASTSQDVALIVSQKAAMAQAAGVFYDVLPRPDPEDFDVKLVSSPDAQSNRRISLSLTS
jgi:hypothetical protein